MDQRAKTREKKCPQRIASFLTELLLMHAQGHGGALRLRAPALGLIGVIPSHRRGPDMRNVRGLQPASKAKKFEYFRQHLIVANQFVIDHQKFGASKLA